MVKYIIIWSAISFIICYLRLALYVILGSNKNNGWYVKDVIFIILTLPFWLVVGIFKGGYKLLNIKIK